MRFEDENIEGDLSLNDALTMRAIILGRTFVEAGGELILHGTCAKNATIKEGGKMTVHGTVNDSILNQGGALEVFGVVNGQIQTNSGKTKIHDGAVVAGGIL